MGGGAAGGRVRLGERDAQGTVDDEAAMARLRAGDAAGLEAKRRWLEGACLGLRLTHPGCRVDIERTGGYRNMREAVERRPEVGALLLTAMRRAGVEPRPAVIRGGTDGARLSERGLPTPNLFAGGMDFHSRTEWVPVQWMEKAAAVIVELVALWAAQRRP